MEVNVCRVSEETLHMAAAKVAVCSGPCAQALPGTPQGISGGRLWQT